MVFTEPRKRNARKTDLISLDQDTRSAAGPAFGQADLSNCEREQIHLAGSTQPHGTLLVADETEGRVVQAADNARPFLGLDDDPVGMPLSALPGDLAERLAEVNRADLTDIPASIQCRVGRRGAVDGLIHRVDGGCLVLEFEPAMAPAADLTEQVEAGLRTIVTATSLRALCDDAVRLFRDITGYDRVMAYCFDDEGHGKVVSEHKRQDLEPFLGNRYPASDIPQMARRLYERNRVRVLADVDYAPVPVHPRICPATGQDLDMSMSFLRSMSPIHIQYLKNMGVSATLVLSLVVKGRLWGLVACHHYSPRTIGYPVRVLCEILIEAMATRVAALDSFTQSQAELAVKRVEQRLVDAVSRDGDWRAALFESVQALLQPVNAGGVALFTDGQVLTAGEVPGTAECRAIADWLDTRPRAPVISTVRLGAEDERFRRLSAVVSGLIATPLSNTPGEYLVWMRPEQIRTETWGGNPFKPVEVGDDPGELSPRRSFSKWHQLVKGTSEPWSTAETAAARAIGAMISDVLLQFRSVRMLIAQDQLTQATRTAERSDQPLIIADAAGTILLINDAARRLSPTLGRNPASLAELFALLTTEESSTAEKLAAATSQRASWRGEVTMDTGDGGGAPLLLRVDPVISPNERMLGFVLLFSDLSERKAAETARNRLQEGIIQRYRLMARHDDPTVDLAYRDLVEKIVGNAQLAALEITDGIDLDRMPDSLECVRTSVSRATELLHHLIWHSTHGPDRRS